MTAVRLLDFGICAVQQRQRQRRCLEGGEGAQTCSWAIRFRSSSSGVMRPSSMAAFAAASMSSTCPHRATFSYYTAENRAFVATSA